MLDYLGRTWRRWLTILAILYVGYASLFYFAQRAILFPGKFRPASNIDLTKYGEHCNIQVDNERVTLLLLSPLPLSEPQIPHKSPLVIYTHGNGELIQDWVLKFQRYQKLGCAVALIEYPGYGGTPGTPSQQSITRAMCLAYDSLIQRPDIDREKIILHGRSLGGGAACSLASERPVAALILESTFHSVSQYADRFWLPRFLCSDPFCNGQVLSGWQKPCLILHGTADRVIPFDHAKQNYVQCPTAKFVLIEGADHNDSPGIFQREWPTIEQFLTDQRLVNQQ